MEAAFITVFVILLPFHFLPLLLLFLRKTQDISLPEKKSERDWGGERGRK